MKPAIFFFFFFCIAQQKENNPTYVETCVGTAWDVIRIYRAKREEEEILIVYPDSPGTLGEVM